MLDNDRDYLIKGEMYQYNLGWLIKELMSFKRDLATAIDLKTIKYADPIQWDITTQYPANTVVVNPKNGTAYMSKVPVPAGVELTNTNYWVVVFNYQDIYNKIMDGVAFNDRDQDYATKDLLVNDLVWYAGDLYRVTRAIQAGSKYIPGTNLIKTTIESLLARYYGRDRTAQIINDTVNVSGDYTLVAGDIAETASNLTLHSTRDMLLDSDGKLTEQITGDREIDVDGNDSVHIDGSSTVNVGGLRTEVYAGDKTEGVTGTYTGKFGSASFETSATNWKVKFPDRTVDIKDIRKAVCINVRDYGAIGDNIADDTIALQKAISENAGKCVYIPQGVYKITDTLIIPNDSFIMGDGVESIIQASNDFTGALMKGSAYDNDGQFNFNFKLENIALDGGYANYVTYTKHKTGVTTQHGIMFKGEQFELDKVIVRNCGGHGIIIKNDVVRGLSSYENAGTSYIINSKVMYNAFDGIRCEGCVDWTLHNSDIHSNSRDSTNAGNNMHFVSGNAKISDCHFFSLYGAIKPLASIFINATAGSIQVSNCHIEGAATPVIIYGNRCFFENCRIYSSFGNCDLRIDADYCTFTNCEFFPQVTDAVPGNYPAWYGAVIFEKNNAQRNNSLVFNSCSLQQTHFTHDTSNLGILNKIDLSGNAPDVGAYDPAKARYTMQGYGFNGNYDSTPYGFPIAGVVGIYDIAEDITLSSTYNFINSYTSGSFTLMRPKLGLLCIIMNNTASDVTVKAANGDTIAGAASVIVPAHSVSFFLGNTDHLWKHFNK